jgi:hypothetical protein
MAEIRANNLVENTLCLCYKKSCVNSVWGAQKFAVPTGRDVVQNYRNSLTLHINSLPPYS